MVAGVQVRSSIESRLVQSQTKGLQLTIRVSTCHGGLGARLSR